MTDRLDCIVIGAGIVGLAAGRRLAMAGLDVIVLDTEDQIGSHTSSRNSEVIHAGIYYPSGSLKARLCVAGKVALYEYCRVKRIPHARIGKLIVATGPDDEAILASIEASAHGNGVCDLEWLTAREVASCEPQVAATAALKSPSTGIIDSHAYMLSLQGDLEACGGSLVLKNSVDSVAVEPGGFALTCGGEPRASVRCRYLVNAAGLWAPSVAARIDGLDPTCVPRGYLAKGHYFTYQGPSPFAHLIYPVPADGGLGIHATNDLSGTARFGPDVEWVDALDYSFRDDRKAIFVAAIRRYFPALNPDKLLPSYTGLRPKLSARGEPAADFRIQGSDTHGVAGLVNLYGIESPGLTASLAIADHVHSILTCDEAS